MKNNRANWIAGVAASVLFSAAVSSHFLYWGERSGRSTDGFCSATDPCSRVSRRCYPARHWVWSGIFPFEGGFIPDPHFTSSATMDFPDSVRKILDSRDATFQVVDVNPAFNDASSEILFLIRSNGADHEYSLEYPKGRHVQAVVGSPSLPDARVFPYHGKLAIVDCFFGPAKGIYLLNLPLKSGDTLHLIPIGSSEFEEIARELKAAANDRTVKQQFCDTSSTAFASFYEKYAGSCEWPAEDYSNNPIVHHFRSLWFEN